MESIGGTLREGHISLTGYSAESVIEDLALDVAFLAMGTVSPKGGFMITISEEIHLERRAAPAAGTVLVLLDPAEFEQESSLLQCGCDEIDTSIAATEFSNDVHARCLGQGLEPVGA